jgi:hypothetical protein
MSTTSFPRTAEERRARKKEIADIKSRTCDRCKRERDTADDLTREYPGVKERAWSLLEWTLHNEKVLGRKVCVDGCNMISRYTISARYNAECDNCATSLGSAHHECPACGVSNSYRILRDENIVANAPWHGEADVGRCADCGRYGWTQLAVACDDESKDCCFKRVCADQGKCQYMCPRGHWNSYRWLKENSWSCWGYKCNFMCEIRVHQDEPLLPYCYNPTVNSELWYWTRTWNSTCIDNPY